MNTRKIIPLLLSVFTVATLSFYACGSSKNTSTGTGTPGSPRDTTTVTVTSKSVKTLTGGTPGSPRDTTMLKKN